MANHLASKSEWWEWLSHSNFSFLTGASHPEDMVQRAHDLSYKGLAITDFDGVYGLVRAFRRQQELGCKNRLKIFYGAELHLAEEHQRPVVYRDSIVLLALNTRGYHQLNQLISLAHKDSKSAAYISVETLLAEASKDIIYLQPMRGMIRCSETSKVFSRYKNYRDTFGENFYLIVSRHLNPVEDQWIGLTLELSQKLGIPYLCSQDSFFHEAKSKELSDVLQAIRLNQTIEESVPHLFVNRERCLHSTAILQQRYQSLPGFIEAQRAAGALAERFNFSLDQLRYQYPQEMLPPEHSAQTYLEYLTWQAAPLCYPSGLSLAIESMLHKELRLIHDLGFSDYFLTVWDIVRWARSQDILCQGRGSAANSAVCYVLGITAVNPSSFDLLFERFISRERGDPPDIDVDFEHERREEVIQYIYQRYGRHRAAMVANVISFRRRSALRMVAKALGIPLSLVEEYAPDLPSHLHRAEDPLEGEDLESFVSESSASLDESQIPLELWQSLAQRIQGFPRHMGIHSGGFVLNHLHMDTICPQEPATMEGRSVIQWAKDDIEYLNIFKIDVLALGMLTALRKAMSLIHAHHGRDLSLANIPQDDPATYQMIQRAETVGTFQIESRAQMAMLPRLRPQNLYDLVVQIGIIRPGPIQGGLIHPYLRRRFGQEPVFYPDPRLEPILKRTLGVPIFQEQVMRMAMAIGHFTAGEADQLRKHIGAWSLNKDLGPLVQKLEDGMRRNGLKEHFIQEILGQLKGFANYGFPESHAASFALLSYASCYIKRHYKEAFYAALLNSQPMGFYSIHALVQAARREGLRFLPIDVNRSLWETILEPSAEPGVFSIRLGFHLVKGLSRVGVKSLIDSRSQCSVWPSLSRFFQASGMNRHDLTALAAANALQCFGIERSQAIWLAEAHPYAPLLDHEEIYQFDPEHEQESLERDFDSFATTLGQHPSQLLRERYWAYDLATRKLTRAIDLRQKSNHSIVHIFGLVLVRQAPMTAKGMEFYTLEDETGFINLAFTPNILALYKNIAHHQAFLCISGRLQREREGHSILVQRVHPRATRPSNLISIEAHREQEARRESLHKLPKARNFQ